MALRLSEVFVNHIARLELLASELQAIGFGSIIPSPTPGQLLQILNFAELLQRWNARIRLVGPSDLDTILREQIVDACGFALALPSLDSSRILDIGAGGGLPGVLLALLYPDREFTLIEPINKKTAFLQQAVLTLELKNLRVHTGRVESEGRIVPPLRSTLDDPPYLALSRATLAPKPWMDLAKPLVGVGSFVLIAIAGEEREPPELTNDSDSVEVGRWTWTLPATGAPRTLIARKVLSTG